MLIRSLVEGGVLLLGGDHPGVIAALNVRGTRVKVGLSVHAEVPILNPKALKKVIRHELEQAPADPQDLSKSLGNEEILALRTMLVLLEDPLENAAAITDLLAAPALVDLTCGARPNEE